MQGIGGGEQNDLSKLLETGLSLDVVPESQNRAGGGAAVGGMMITKKTTG